MRTSTVEERSRSRTTGVANPVKVEIQDSDGTWRDWSHRVVGPGTACRAHRDDQVSTARFSLARGTGEASLAPTMAMSLVNRDAAGNFAPAIDKSRAVRISTATVAAGFPSTAGDFREVFTGRINEVGYDQDPMPVSCSDLGAWMMDKQIREEATYGSPGGTALQTVMQDMIDANPNGKTLPAVYTPVDPIYFLTEHTVDTSMLMTALLDQALKIGGDFRYRYDSLHVSRPTFLLVDRARVDVDETFEKQQYFRIEQLKVAIGPIRNNGRQYWRDSSGVQHYVEYENPTSVADDGDRYFQIPEQEGLDTEVENQTMINAAGSDLSGPGAEKVVFMPYCWWVQIHDRYAFKPNYVHFDTTQTMAVAGYSHDWDEQLQLITTLTGTERIVGAYAAWSRRLSKDAPVVPATDPTVPTAWIGELSSTPTTVTLAAGGAADEGVTGDLEWQKIEWTDALEAVPAWPGTWETSVLPTSIVVTRASKWTKFVRFRVRDAGARESEYVQREVTSEWAFVNDDGEPKRDQPYDDGGYGVKATDTAGLSIHAGVKESSTRDVNRFLAKDLLADPDDFDSVPEGTAFKRTTGNEKTGAGRGYDAIDSGGVLIDTAVDFARTYTGKHAANLPRSSGDPTPIWTIVTHLGNTGHAASTFQDSDARLVGRFMAKALVADPDDFDSVPEGTTYKRTTANEKTGAGRGYTGLDASARVLRTLGFDDGEYALRSYETTGTTAAEDTQEYGGKDINRLYAKALPADSDDADSITPGAVQAAVNVGYLDASARPTALRDPTLAADVGANDINVGQLRARTGLNAGGEVALDLPSTIGQSDGIGVRVLAKGHVSGSCRHGDSVVFPSNFQNVPMVLITGGIGHEPRAKWGTTGSGSETGAVSVVLPQYADVAALGLDVVGFTMRARLRQKAGSTPRSHSFAGTALNGVGDFEARNLDNAPANNDTYTVQFDVDVTANTATGIDGTTSNTVTVTVAIDVDDGGGSGFMEKATRTYSVSSTTSGPASVNHVGLQVAVVVANLGTTDDIRLRIKTLTLNPETGGGSTSVSATNVTYSTSSDTYASKTPDTDDRMYWEAVETA